MDYRDVLYFYEKQIKEEAYKRLRFILDSADSNTMANTATASKKGIFVYKRWHKKLERQITKINEIEPKKKPTLWDYWDKKRKTSRRKSNIIN
jgi:hypothetical protein